MNIRKLLEMGDYECTQWLIDNQYNFTLVKNKPSVKLVERIQSYNDRNILVSSELDIKNIHTIIINEEYTEE